MATGISKTDLSGHTGLTEVSQWISQINVGGNIYDIATHHNITFKNGSDSLIWNGLTDIEVNIPTLADLVENPVEFVGTVGSNGTISYSTSGHTLNKGDLVYITADCTFEGVACEAGDMAIYDGSKWNVISGENQVEIQGTMTSNKSTIALTGVAKDVLKVEGKTLALSVDYDAVATSMNSGLQLTKNDAYTIALSNGSVTVGNTYVALSKVAGAEKTIAVDKAIDLPTALANGAVTISDKVLASTDFSFTQGSFPTISMNAAAIDVTVSTSLNLGKTNATDASTGDFVASIDGAVKEVKISAGTSASNDIAYVASVSLVDSTSKTYISNFRVAASTETAAFTVPGAYSLNADSYVTGLGNAAASGDVVSSVAVGGLTFDSSSKSDFVTGLSDNSAKVITSVSFGDIAQDSSREWFVTGISGATQVVTDVVVNTPTFTSGNTTFASSAFVAASVNNNILSFSTADFMKPVSISMADPTITKNNLVKGGVKLSGQSLKDAAFNKGGYAQGTVAVSYKSFTSAQPSLSQAAGVGYIFDNIAAPEIVPVTGYKSLVVTAAEIKKNGYQLNNNTFSGKIAVGAVATGLNAGTLPTLSISDPSTTISGSVSTALTTTSVSWYAVATDASKITLGDTYSLVADSTVSGAIEVGKAGQYAVSGDIDIAVSSFVTDVKISLS